VSPESWRWDRFRGGLFVFDGAEWHRLDVAATGLLANDISVVSVAPNGDVWIGTEGWGLARFRPGAEPPTATPTSGARTATPTATSREPTPTVSTGTPGGATPTGTPTGATPTPTGSAPTPTARPGGPPIIYLPFASQWRR
jgi:hypothetical protein